MIEGSGLLAAKVAIEAVGVVAGTAAGVFAVTDNTAITVTAITAVLGFAGLLVRQVTSAQKYVWQIVEAKDKRIEELEDHDHYMSWEMEKLRFTYGERIIDPGPYMPRTKAGTA